MKLNKQIISINGVPRSGTSWLGQIFNSHPDVAFRFQPLFSYKFKSAIKLDSDKKEMETFFTNLYNESQDEFILQKKQITDGVHLEFKKNEFPSHLVMKEVRYHYLIKKLLSEIENIKVIGIVRHPCGAINSWLKTPREFKPDWSREEEWRFGNKKNQSLSEEYNGFEKWKEVAQLFLELKEEFPTKFYLIKYEDLVENTMEETKKIFEFSGLSLSEQTKEFIVQSHSKEIDHPDTIFRNKNVKERWEKELEPEIRDTIISEIEKTNLKKFL